MAGKEIESKVIVQTDTYEVRTCRVGKYRVVRLIGKYENEVLDDLRTKVFPEDISFAIDASGLKGFTTPFARELFHSARLLQDAALELVLLRPPDALQSLMTLISPDTLLPVFLSEDQLLDDVGDSSSRTGHAATELERIVQEFRSNKIWQYFDRGGSWICAFCGRLQEDVTMASPQDITYTIAELVYRHLWHQCANYSPRNPAPLSPGELDDARKEINKQKVVVTRKSMKKMVSDLTYLGDKARAAESLQKSVRIASERQRRLMPDEPPEMPGAEIGIIYRPAEQVSGDFYDFVPLRNGRVAVLIGDVAGHGMEAGILMGMSKKILAVRLSEEEDPVQAVVKANKDLFSDLSGVAFVTVLVAIFDPNEGTVTSVRGGHNPMMRFNPDREPALRQFTGGGLGIGLTAASLYEEKLLIEEESIHSGDVFLLYTDGLVEAMNKEKKEFQIDRVVAVLEKSKGIAPSLLLQDLTSELDRFVGGKAQEDDITAVCIRFE